MSASHSRAESYRVVPESLNTTGQSYPIPAFPDDDRAWLAGARVLVISADGPELPEIDIPIDYLRKRGAEVKLAGQDWIFQFREPAGYIVIAQWIADNICVKADLGLSDVKVSDYDAIFIPGGAWNPDMLRIDDKALKIVREARKSGLLIVSLCHGPQVLINAAATTADEQTVFPPGTCVTGVENIRVDLKNAGFTVIDGVTVYDRESQLLTARNPSDLGPLCMEMGNLLRRRIEQRTKATGGQM